MQANGNSFHQEKCQTTVTNESTISSVQKDGKNHEILCTEMENMSLTLTLPIARRPLSKNISIPMNKNAIPNPAKPTPISERENPIYT